MFFLTVAAMFVII